MRETTLDDLQRLAADGGAAAVTLQMDEEAFRAFYDRTARTLWAYLSRITGDRQMADDLLQETYYRFLRADRPYESDLHRRNSLFRIATNLAHDARRRRLTRPTDQLAHPGSFTGPGNVADETVMRTDLARAMARLKPRERQLLWLAYGQGESHQDIAATLGLRRGSIKLLLFRARRRLAAFLGGGR